MTGSCHVSHSGVLWQMLGTVKGSLPQLVLSSNQSTPRQRQLTCLGAHNTITTCWVLQLVHRRSLRPWLTIFLALLHATQPRHPPKPRPPPSTSTYALTHSLTAAPSSPHTHHLNITKKLLLKKQVGDQPHHRLAVPDWLPGLQDLYEAVPAQECECGMNLAGEGLRAQFVL